MRLKVFPSTVEFAPSLPLSLFTSSSRLKIYKNSCFLSKRMLSSRSFKKFSTIRSNLGEICREEDSLRVQRLAKNLGQIDSEEHLQFDPFTRTDRDSFLNSRFDFLEPMMLGIRPDHPDCDTVMWATIEQKAKSLEIPLSLRMIKKKLQYEEGFLECRDPTCCSMRAAFSLMVFIVVELQRHALQMQENLYHEELDVIITKVRKEMNSSFVWLFQQVFSKTPTLMIKLMILLVNFSVYSAFQSGEYQESRNDLPQIGQDPSFYPIDRFMSVTEIKLWNSILEEVKKMRQFGIEDEVLDHDTCQHFVSPVSVELESDVNEDYLRTDVTYQMNLSREPNNRLLLCNYAQFLQLVAQDYDRAEECFKRSVQISPADAESLYLYANFLWTVKSEFWAAEEMFLQALAIEPDNSYYASRYAYFLWNTGGEETCFPSNNFHNPNLWTVL